MLRGGAYDYDQRRLDTPYGMSILESHDVRTTVRTFIYRDIDPALTPDAYWWCYGFRLVLDASETGA